MKDLKTSLNKFNSITEKLNSIVEKYDSDSKVNNIEDILLKENQKLKNKYADTLNKLEKILAASLLPEPIPPVNPIICILPLKLSYKITILIKQYDNLSYI